MHTGIRMIDAWAMSITVESEEIPSGFVAWG